MKTRSSFSTSILAIAVCSLVISCSKQIDTPATPDETTASAVATANNINNDCKAMVFAAYVERPDGVKFWKTLMQKWYGMDGKLSYLKAHIGHDPMYYTEFEIDLAWGEVTYSGNDVHVRNTLTNKQLVRITVDDEGRPATSYYANEGGPYNLNTTDTSYYYYAGAHLDSIFSTSTRVGPIFPFLQYSRITKFYYDPYGNLKMVSSGNTRWFFTYDYTQPVNNMLGSYQFGFPSRLLEFMGLINYPMHHKLVHVKMGEYQPGSSYPDEVYPTFFWNYINQEYTNEGAVYAYSNNVPGFSYVRFYTGWECESAIIKSAASQKNNFNSLEEFQRVYGQPGK